MKKKAAEVGHACPRRKEALNFRSPHLGILFKDLMPPKHYKQRNKPAKYPKTTGDQDLSGLDNYIIRTRRQSQREKAQIEINMAERNTVCSQPEILDNMSKTLECIKENDACSSLNASKETEVILQSTAKCLNTAVAGSQEEILDSNEMASLEKSSSAIGITGGKGKVAELVEKLNHTPCSSPTSSPRSKTQQEPNAMSGASPPRHRSRMEQTSTVTNDLTPSQQLNQIIAELTATSKELQSSVEVLKTELSNMREQKEKQDEQVSLLLNTQKAESARLDAVLNKISEQDQRFEALVGVITKQDQEINSLKKINNMSMRAMRFNMTISGIIEERGENPKWKVLEFLKDKLRIQDNITIQSAYRIGNGSDRPIMFTLQKIEDKAKIYQGVQHLKGVKNSKNKSFFVSDQLLEDYAERKKQENYIKSQNNKLPIAQQIDMSFKKGALYVQGNKFEPPISAPTIWQMVLPTAEEKQISEQIEIFEGDTRDLKSSTFVGYAVRVKKMEQVNGAYRAVRRKHPDATHVMCAFRFPGNNPTRSFGLADDGENGGARRIFSLLNSEHLYNIAVFVVRYYGGINLGPDRFAFIESVSKSAVAVLLDNEKPESTPWEQGAEPQNASWDDQTQDDGRFDMNEPGLPNEGCASLLNPNYLQARTLSSSTQRSISGRSNAETSSQNSQQG